jgi:hypothetical protein
MTPFDVREMLAEVQDAQALVLVSLSGWLLHPSEAALARLVEARKREGDLVQLIITPTRKPGWPQNRSRKAEDETSDEARR